MNTPPFIDRSRELALLESEWQSKQARMLILYGRRRIGKTRLLTHWINTASPRALYWVAEPTSSAGQLRSFSQALFGFESSSPVPDSFSYSSWKQAFEQVARMAQHERLALILDEFTYMIALEKGLSGILQNAWDHSLKNTNLFLIISGSHLGMMEREVLSYQAPLYGRATTRLHLLPLPFKATQGMFPKFKTDERVALYAIFGGVPAYWEQFDPSLSLDQNIKEHLLNGAYLSEDEPRLLLQDFVSEIHNYVAILHAIANGYRTPRDIARAAGLNERHISMYVKNLLQTGFVERRIPVTTRGATRQGRHYISDPYLRFYYRFLSHRQAQLALGVQDQALVEIKKHLVNFIGAHTWEELSREWLLRVSGKNIIPFLPDQIGSIWNKEAQIDVAGVNFMEKTLVLGECKWNNHPTGTDVLKSLIAKTDKVLPREGHWHIYYLGFSRCGWKQSALDFARDFSNQGIGGDRWQAKGILLRDLNEIDQELADWTD
jgi:AAA+ ATPase superfamily predicted ATPase